MTHGADHPFLDMIRERISVERFDPSRSLSEAEIRQLVDDAIQAPSSFNIQHWRFVAVRSPSDKLLLKRAAHGQNQVVDAAVTFILLGDLQGVDKLPQVMELSVERGSLPPGKAAAWVRMAQEIYSDERLARDEAIRSGSLAAMVMMLAAQARGLASGALTGFDPQMLKKDFQIPDRYLPVMLLTIGYPAAGARSESPQPRLGVDQVLAFDRCREF